MEKHAAYCAMIRLGLKVPPTVLVPQKDPPDNARFQYTAARYNLPFDLPAIAEKIGYPLFMKPTTAGSGSASVACATAPSSSGPTTSPDSG